jgi:hypothetical protein
MDYFSFCKPSWNCVHVFIKMFCFLVISIFLYVTLLNVLQIKIKNVSTNLYFFLPDVSDIFTGPANHIKCQLKHSPNLCTTFTNDFCFFFEAISVLHFVECRCLSEAISACHAAALQRILIRQEMFSGIPTYRNIET